MYCYRKVTDDLYWIGANDHRLALFENVHPIPTLERAATENNANITFLSFILHLVFLFFIPNNDFWKSISI